MNADENVRQERRETLEDYFRLQDRRDAAIRLRALIKDELDEVKVGLDGIRNSYMGQQQDGNGYEGEKSAVELLRREYYEAEVEYYEADAEGYRERLEGYLKSADHAILRDDAHVKAKRAAMDRLTHMKVNGGYEC